MRQLTHHVPRWIVTGSLLTGAMAAGAAISCQYAPIGQMIDSRKTDTCSGLACDKGDNDDCGSRCTCNDETGRCVAE